MEKNNYIIYNVKTGEKVYVTHYIDAIEHVQSGRFDFYPPVLEAAPKAEEVKKEEQVKEDIKEQNDAPIIPDTSELQVPDQLLDVTVEEVTIPQPIKKEEEEKKEPSIPVKVGKRTKTK